MNTRKARIYISGSITGDPDFADKFSTAEEYLESIGLEVVNPAKLNNIMPASATWDDYMYISVSLLKLCDAIFMLNGWEKSKGAVIERDYALELGMQIAKEGDGSIWNVVK